MIDDRLRIVATDDAARFFLSLGDTSHGAWILFGGEIRQLRQVLADEVAVGVELLGLCHRIEDAEVGLRVAAGRRGPLPAAVVGGEVVVVQLAREVSLAAAPVEPQVLGQEATRSPSAAGCACSRSC